jgi:hypothetical protein
VIAIIPANPLRKRGAEPPSRPQLPQALVAAARSISCLGNVSRIHPRWRRCSLPGDTSRRKCCAMANLTRSVGGAHDVRARGLPQFPITPDLKNQN